MDTNYRDVVKDLTRPATEEEKQIEMMAMFLCNSGIIPLGPSGDGNRLSGGHGWHRTSRTEQEAYRRQAKLALKGLTEKTIPHREYF